MSMFLFFALPVWLLYVPWFLYTREKFSDSDKTSSSFGVWVSEIEFYCQPDNTHISQDDFWWRSLYSFRKKISEWPKKLRWGCVHQDAMYWDLKLDKKRKKWSRTPIRSSCYYDSATTCSYQISIITATVTADMQQNIDNPFLKVTGGLSLQDEPSQIRNCDCLTVG